MPSKRKRMKPVTGWAVMREGRYMWRSGLVFRTRREAMDDWCLFRIKPWAWWYQRGYRCVRVTVQEATR